MANEGNVEPSASATSDTLGPINVERVDETAQSVLLTDNASEVRLQHALCARVCVCVCVCVCVLRQ